MINLAFRSSFVLKVLITTNWAYICTCWYAWFSTRDTLLPNATDNVLYFITGKAISGLVNVKYCNAPTILRYLVESSAPRGSPSFANNFSVVDNGVLISFLAATCVASQSSNCYGEVVYWLAAWTWKYFSISALRLVRELDSTRAIVEDVLILP